MPLRHIDRQRLQATAHLDHVSRREIGPGADLAASYPKSGNRSGSGWVFLLRLPTGLLLQRLIHGNLFPRREHSGRGVVRIHTVRDTLTFKQLGHDECPSCGVMVVAGELHRGGHASFASFHEAETSSAYLMLPTPSWRIAPRFVASIFGDHA